MPNKPIEKLKKQIGDSVVTTTDFKIEAGKVEEFARAIKDDNPAYRGKRAAEEQGFDEIPAPLIFTRTAYFPRYRPKGIDALRLGFDLGLELSRTVHGEHEYEFERQLFVGNLLTGTTTLAEVYQREGSKGTLTFIVYETEYHNRDEELVLTERLTRIELPSADETSESESHD